jgi:hypothetical protein
MTNIVIYSVRWVAVTNKQCNNYQDVLKLQHEEKLMAIEILGEGCSKCSLMKKNVLQAINDLGLHTEVNVAMDPERIAKLEVLYLPQLVIDGQITPSSIWRSIEDLKELLRTASRQD